MDLTYLPLPYDFEHQEDGCNIRIVCVYQVRSPNHTMSVKALIAAGWENAVDLSWKPEHPRCPIELDFGFKECQTLIGINGTTTNACPNWLECYMRLLIDSDEL